MTNINMVPEFASDEAKGIEEVKETTPVVEETETPAELPADQVETPEEQPAEPVQTAPRDDTGDLVKQVQGLREEKEKLLQAIQDLRGTRREIKKDELIKVNQQIDELKDVNPEDVSLIDKVLRSKGYITKDESHKMFYESVKQEEIGKFLEKFPEYKPENDPNDLNWGALERKLKTFYRMPDDPRMVGTLLEEVHRSLAKVSSDQHLDVKRQQLKTAGVGTRGVPRSSSQKSLDPDKRAMLVQGGWSEEEIKQIETRL